MASTLDEDGWYAPTAQTSVAEAAETLPRTLSCGPNETLGTTCHPVPLSETGPLPWTLG